MSAFRKDQRPKPKPKKPRGMIRCPMCGNRDIGYSVSPRTGEFKGMEGVAKEYREYKCANPSCRNVWRKYEVISQRIPVILAIGTRRLA